MKEYGPKVEPISASKPFSRGSGPQIETIPVQPVVYPKQGKPSVLSGVPGRAPFTPDPLVRDSIASEAVGRFVLPHGGLLNGTAWKKLNVERPTIVMALTVDTPGILDATGPRILYNYGKIPDTDQQAQTSQCVGTCFLSNPGVWYLKAVPNDLESSYDIDCILIDASHPEVARRMLDQPGCDFVIEENLSGLTSAVATLVSFGRYARAVTVQNVPPIGAAGEVVRYVIGQPDTELVTAGAWTGAGFRLLVNGSVTFSGKHLNTFGIYACSESATAANLEVARFMD